MPASRLKALTSQQCQAYFNRCAQTFSSIWLMAIIATTELCGCYSSGLAAPQPLLAVPEATSVAAFNPLRGTECRK